MTTTDTKPQLLNVEQISTMFQISTPHIWRLNAAGKIPKSVRIGGSVRWLQSDIETWLAIGCPSRKEFEARKKEQKKGKK